MANLISWFEIPVIDMERASKFYGTLLGREVQPADIMGTPYAFLPNDNEGIGGALAQGEHYQPSDRGVTIYFAMGDDLAPALARVEPAGGKVLTPKTLIDEENGYFAIILDTEGNRIGLHSAK
ncbi:MAG TPA: hypothetical protein DEP84_04685 [Chloroflexi bacterium]|nr:hypothetical protein [Chloroflexota bacterium]